MALTSTNGDNQTGGDKIWTDDVLAVVGKVIDLEDNIISSSTLAVKAIDKLDYKTADDLLPSLFHLGRNLELTAIELMKLKPDRVGASPKWFRLADKVLGFGGRVQRAIDLILDEKEANRYPLIIKRFKGMKAACIELQLELIKAIPKKTIRQTFADPRPDSDVYETLRPDPARSTLEILDTLSKGKTTRAPGIGRWRRKRR